MSRGGNNALYDTYVDLKETAMKKLYEKFQFAFLIFTLLYALYGWVCILKSIKDVFRKTPTTV